MHLVGSYTYLGFFYDNYVDILEIRRNAVSKLQRIGHPSYFERHTLKCHLKLLVMYQSTQKFSDCSNHSRNSKHKRLLERSKKPAGYSATLIPIHQTTRCHIPRGSSFVIKSTYCTCKLTGNCCGGNTPSSPGTIPSFF